MIAVSISFIRNTARNDTRSVVGLEEAFSTGTDSIIDVDTSKLSFHTLSVSNKEFRIFAGQADDSVRSD